MSPSTARKSASARRVAPRRATAPAPEPAKKDAGVREGKKVRGTFVMPEADHALIAKLKLSAKRNGLKVKKSELFRLGLRALDALGSSELRDRVMTLRTPSSKRNGK